jgi:uncharacterized delta-60 repeat protein
VRFIRREARVLVLAVVGLLFAAGVAMATAGDLDTTFGQQGKRLIDLRGGRDYGSSVAVGSHKSLFVGGSSYKPGSDNGDFALVRLKRDGAFNRKFGNHGRVFTDFNGGNDNLSAIARQPDGKIVAVGQAETGPATGVQRFAVARYNPNGTLDHHFSHDGRVTTGIANTTYPEADDVVIQGDGRIVVGGTAGSGVTYRAALARYTAAGRLDGTFSGDGRVVTAFPGGGIDDAFYALTLDGGTIVAAGQSDQGATGYDFAVARYTSHGAPDKSFSTDGFETTDFGTSDYEEAYGVALDDQGRIVAGGNADVGNDSNFGLARYQHAGGLDTSFDGDGLEIESFAGIGHADWINALLLAPSGKIITAGPSGPSTVDFSVARFKANGGLDHSFSPGGTPGIEFTDLSGDFDYPTDLAKQGSKFVLVGRSMTGPNPDDLDFAVARYVGK